ncbi:MULTISPECIES: hypothetical protein [Nocardia]|uniref:hypothetical protein n=1 Tax=Nocardia TaxID=1817 RepID=UPI001561C51C|nr:MULTISPECIES: hypothetical protein [Nocardia]MBF6408833.1 hypothetical protein [Nocardia farcinica]UEX23881.1 hypothetical protein LMJ57_05180 [Nocardia farcinica]
MPGGRRRRRRGSGTAWSDLATVFVVLVLYTVARPTLHLTHVVVTGTEARPW